MRLSIYLIKGYKHINDYIKKDIKVLKKNLSQNFNNGEGLFIYERIKSELDWIKKIKDSNILDSGKIDESKENTRGTLIIKLTSIEEPTFFVLSFNGGIHLIKNHLIDYNFGYEIARKMIHSSRVKKYGSIDIHDQVMRTNKNSSNYIPNHLIGDNLILSSIESITGYSDDDKYYQGNKGLILNYAGKFDKNLLELLEFLYLNYSKEDQDDSFNKIKKIKNIKEIETLDMYLIEKILSYKEVFLKNGRELKNNDLNDINLSINFDNKTEGYKYTGFNRTKKIYKDIDKYDYFEQLSNYIDINESNIDNAKILRKIKTDKIVSIKENIFDYDDLDEATIYNSLFININKFEKDSDYKAVLIEGNWYRVDRDYYSQLNNRLKEKIIDNKNIITNKFDFIAFNKSIHKDEEGYNKALADKNNGVCLDRKNYTIGKEIKDRKYSGYSKIEPCDVLLYDDKESKYYFLHIKINDGTQGISHLSTQANIATNLLLDKEICEDFLQHINNHINIAIDKNPDINVPKLLNLNNNFVVILGVIDKNCDKKLKKNFTVLKLQALDNSVSRLQQLGVDVKIKFIKNNSK